MEINLLHRTNSLTAIDTVTKQQTGFDLPAQVIAAVRAINKSEFLGSDRELQFTRDRSTRTTIIQVVDRSTGEILEQIPPKKVLQIMGDLTKSNKEDSTL